ncbi:hypothetical protein GCM10011316_05100 [Roseibium aquae]|uniref:Extensin-like C-terminal domain-containing protein n=1 Tax=Roseibium aquae TaxID=1323746 RepID=A0A916TA05_9HYPH|nr:extensin family protein [Roseibium aquae]GGB35933.1 hypothetical protein GCM10011316_05100 [Roseibium aquae]
MAEIPAPEAKPLADAGLRPFSPGVDLPPAKPLRVSAPPERKPALAHQSSGETEAGGICRIQNADVEPGPPIKGKGGCGVERPVRLKHAILGTQRITLSGEPSLDCPAAQAVTDWLRKDIGPLSVRLTGSPLVRLVTGPGYVCRHRNNDPAAKLSEHARGRALDVTAFEFADGLAISVEEDWGAATDAGRFLAAAHKAACERFTTVLGPAADDNHKAHFHLDTVCRGPDCGYRICQ